MSRGLWLFTLCAASVSWGNSRDSDEARLQRLVPWEIDALARSAPECSPPGVHFTRVDFAGDGSFQYVVASYFAVCGSRVTSAVRVLREVDQKLLPEPIPASLSLLIGHTLLPEVLDLENNGVPEILFRKWKGADTNKPYTLLLFRWTEGALRPVPTETIDTREAVFRDINADGRLALVSPHCQSREKRKRKLNFPHKHHISATSKCSQATAYVYAAGEFKEVELRRSEAKLARVSAVPGEFSMAEINEPQSTPPTDGEFVLQLLRHYNPEERLTPIKPETLLLGRVLHPITVTTRAEPETENCLHDSSSRSCPPAEVITAKFSRNAVARLLPKLQLIKKLEAGDSVSVPVAALLENDDYISTMVRISIVKSLSAVRNSHPLSRYFYK